MVTKIEIRGYAGTQIAGILKKSLMKSYDPVILQLGSKEKNTILLQLTLIISTPLISILSLMSNWFLSPDYFPYVFIVFQLCVCRTTFMSTLRLSRSSLSVPEYIFHSFYYRVSRTRTMTKETNVRCGAAGLSVYENHNRPLINKSIF